jgi:hypothetical protein
LLYFNDTTTRRGIIQSIERRLFPNQTGRISGNASLLTDFTAEVNLARDRLTALILKVSGQSAPEDYNHPKYPIIQLDLVSGQRDYTFLQDQEGSNILDIYKVVAYDSNGNGTELIPVEVRGDDQRGALNWIAGFYNGSANQGASAWYSRTANGLFLGYTPNYTTNGASTGHYGIELYISREPTYYLSSDTTKQTGFPGLFDEYLALVPAWKYAAMNGLEVAGGRLRNGAFTGMLSEIQVMEQDISTYYGQRLRDSTPGLRARRQNNR